MISDSYVKKLLDIMRKDKGLGGNMQRLEQLAWLIFLKVLDSREDDLADTSSGYTKLVPEDLRWSTWAINAEGLTGDGLLNFINGRLFPELRTISSEQKEHQLADVIEAVLSEVTNFARNGTNLRQVVNELNKIDLHRADDRHAFNDIYEKILKQLQSAKDSGEYYTPRPLTKLIAEMVDPKIGEVVFDPACGTGGFLVNAVESMRSQAKGVEDEYIIQRSIKGYEVKQLPHILCTTNMLLHGIDDPAFIKHDNTLTRPLRDYGPADKVDVILANPPFGGEEEVGIEKNFPANYQTRETADLFMTLFIHLLKQNGRAGVVLPDTFLSGEGVKSRIKARLFEECNLHTVVRLPGGEFTPYAAPKVCLLFFQKGTPTKEVWFYELPLPEGVGINGFTKTKPLKDAHLDPIRRWWGNRVENECAWKVSAEVLRDRNYNLNVANPSKKSDEYRGKDELLDEISELATDIQLLVKELTESLR